MPQTKRIESCAVEELLALLDKWLALTAVRDRFTTDEIQDFILDLRTIATREPEPVAG